VSEPYPAISGIFEAKRGRARDFGEQLKGLLQDALALQHAPDGQVPDFKADAEALQADTTHQVRDRCLKDANNQRLLNELDCHHDGGSLLRFLVDPRFTGHSKNSQ
jgi:hypothetical protein